MRSDAGSAEGRGLGEGSRGLVAGLWLLAAVAVAGCGGPTPNNGLRSPSAPDSTPGHVRVVAEFLEAAGRRDHGAMAARFGTGGGPIGETGGAFGCAFRRVGSWIGLGDRCLRRAEAELRMDVIARVLVHESYRVEGEEGVVGRGRAAVRVRVEVVTGGRVVVVPFVVIRADDGRWLVEEVGLGGLVFGRLVPGTSLPCAG